MTREKFGNAHLLELPCELLLEVVEKVGVEVLSSQVGVTGSSLDGENTTLNVQERHIESTSTEIVDKNISLLLSLPGTETVSDSSGSGLVDDTENVETSNGTSILCSLTLVVVEVGGNSDNSLCDLLAKLDFGDLLHLFEIVRDPIVSSHRTNITHLSKDHGGDFLRRESLGLSKVLNLNHWCATLVGDLKWPRLDILLDSGIVESPPD